MFLDGSFAYHALEEQHVSYEGALAVVDVAYDDQVEVGLLAAQFSPIRSGTISASSH
jgi:hypothetical protein